jgi:hypothetical protein
MPFANRHEFITQIKSYYFDPIASEEIDGLVYNFGFDAVNYYSKDSVERLFTRPGEEIINPLTRRNIENDKLARVPDWHGTAILHLFRKLGYFDASAQPASGSIQRSETQPLITTQPGGAQSIINFPTYYDEIAKNLPSDHSQLPCHCLFLEPLVPTMPDQQRILICPFIASDGGTYNLATLMYLFANNVPSPITGKFIENFSITFNRIIANLLTDCWNAPAEFTARFYSNSSYLSALIMREKVKYNLTEIDLMLDRAASIVKKRGQHQVLRVNQTVPFMRSMLSNSCYFFTKALPCLCPTLGAMEAMPWLINSAVCSAVNAYIGIGYGSAIVCLSCTFGGIVAYRAQARSHLLLAGQIESSVGEMLRSVASKHLISGPLSE